MKIEYFIVMFFAAFLAPTNYNFIRQSYIPSFISPSFLFCVAIFLGISIKVFCNEGWLPCIPQRLLILYASLIVLMLISLIFTPNLEYGLSKVSDFVTVTAFACFSPFFLFRDEHNIKCFLRTFIMMGLLLVAFLFISAPYSYSYEFQTQFGSNYLLIQHISGIAGLIILYYYLSRTDSIRHILCLVFIFTLTTGAMLYVGGKGPVLTFFITTVFMAMTSIKLRHPLRVTFNRSLVAFPFLVIGIGLFALTFFMLTQDFSALIWRIGFVLSGEHYSQIERLENIKVALDLLTQSPFFGVGLGGFSVFSFEIEGIERFKYPHNILLEILSELGLTGFISFSLILFFAFRHLLRLQGQYKDSSFPNVFVSIFIFTLLNSLSSQDINNRALFAFIGASFAIEQVLRKKKILTLSA